MAVVPVFWANLGSILRVGRSTDVITSTCVFSARSYVVAVRCALRWPAEGLNCFYWRHTPRKWFLKRGKGHHWKLSAFLPHR
jgi:hypothetical protein